MQASTYVLCLTSPLNVGLNIALVHHTSLGFLGSPVAMNITYWLSFLILAGFTFFSPAHKSNKTWGGWQVNRVFSWVACWDTLKLAIPGIIMVATEWYLSPETQWTPTNCGALFEVGFRNR